MIEIQLNENLIIYKEGDALFPRHLLLLMLITLRSIIIDLKNTKYIDGK
ncbi:hypothetical protein [Anaeromicropila herbilytica]|nr:hypothetical protein [Anaeromicropila herbilytica]